MMLFRTSGLNFRRKRRKMKLSTAKSAAAWAVEILIVLLVAFVLVYCAGMRVTMVGNSMESTVSDGSQILVNRFIYNVKSPKSGDVIVFLPNGNEKSHYYVKRVIGVPGDKVQIKSGLLYVNGELYDTEDTDTIKNAGVAEEEISPLFGTRSTEKWQAAANAAKAVFDLNKYYLKTVNNSEEYGALFYDVKNPEVIFEKLFDPKYGSGDNNSFLYQAPCGIGNGFQGWGNFNPTQNLVDKFQMADGTASEKKTHYDYYPWNGREIRFYAAFLLDGDEWGYGKDKREVEVYYGGDETIPAGKDSNWGEYWWNASNTGYSMRKFLDPSYDATGTTMHTTPWFFIRLSEIYLNYAECQIELGNNSEALEYINKVRTRALLPPATGEDIRAEYEYERQIELVFEGQRWFDLRRWKKMYEEYSKPIYGVTIGKFKNEDGTYRKEYWTDNIVSTRVFNNDKLYWVPVPRWELNKSKLIDAAPYE